MKKAKFRISVRIDIRPPPLPFRPARTVGGSPPFVNGPGDNGSRFGFIRVGCKIYGRAAGTSRPLIRYGLFQVETWYDPIRRNPMRFLTIPLVVAGLALPAATPSFASEAEYLASLQGNLKGTGFAKLRTNRAS